MYEAVRIAKHTSQGPSVLYLYHDSDWQMVQIKQQLWGLATL